MLNHEFVQPIKGINWATENMVVFYVGFAQQRMGVKVYEKTQIEWDFEDIVKCTAFKFSNGDDDDDGEIRWVQMHLNRAPNW